MQLVRPRTIGQLRRSAAGLRRSDFHQRRLRTRAGRLRHVYDRQGQKVKATTYYLRAIKRTPKDASIANDLGLCYARQGKFDEALNYLNKAVELQPDRELYRNNIATVLVELGRVDEAVTQVANVYGEPIAHYNVGVVLEQRGRHKAAAEQFELALRKDPGCSRREWLAQLEAEDEPASDWPARGRRRHDIGQAGGRDGHSDSARGDVQPAASSRPAMRLVSRPADDRSTAAPVVTAAQPPLVDAAATPEVPPTPDKARQLPTSGIDSDAAQQFDVRPLPKVQSGFVPPSRY